MSKNKLIWLIVVLIFCNCTKTSKDKSNKQNTIIIENKELIINLKSITICKSIENEQKSPTFLFNINLINKTSEKIVFFVQNFDEKVYRGSFFLNFFNNDEEIIVELADFLSANPVIIDANDTAKIMLTSLTDSLTEIKWDAKERNTFIETIKIIYYPKLDELHKDTTLFEFKILESFVIFADEKTRIFE